MRDHTGEHGRALERRTTRQQEIKRAAQAINVGAMVDIVRVVGLLGAP